jgi:hypothetical protein
MPLSNVEQVVIVAAGAVLTLLLGTVVLYWVRQEWRQREAQHRCRNEISSSPGSESGSGPPPTEPPSTR